MTGITLEGPARARQRVRELVAAMGRPEVGGRISAAGGLLARVRGLELPVGSVVQVDTGGSAGSSLAEVVGFSGEEALVMPFSSLEGIGARSAVYPVSERLEVPVGEFALGRVFDGAGRLIDGGPAAPATVPRRPVATGAPHPVERGGIVKPLALGIRALDGLATCAEGGRIGLFAAAGVGKSTLLSAITRRAEADAVVVCLVGERSREVREVLEGIRAEAPGRVAVVASTASDPPLARARAPLVATTLAESLRDLGGHVVLVMDSLTRYAQALREIGLACGEAPAARGYPPSALVGLAPLLERAGPGVTGAITGLYTVLVEGDDPDEPVADAARSFLDGHVELSRGMARRGLFPPVDPLGSISRLQDRVVEPGHRSAARAFRKAWALYEETRDLISVGAYRSGTDPRIDAAVRLRPELEAYLRQEPEEAADYQDSLRGLLALGDRIRAEGIEDE